MTKFSIIRLNNTLNTSKAIDVFIKVYNNNGNVIEIISIDEIIKSLIDNDITDIPYRRCSICGDMTFIRFTNNRFFYDSNCECISHRSTPKLKDNNFIYEFINNDNNLTTKINKLKNIGLLNK